jgi:SAM-dependent methyltransferase
MIINPSGYWENPTAEGHEHDAGVAKAIADFLENEPRDFPVIQVLDVGCGDGYYTNYLNNRDSFKNDNGYFGCHGIDGNPNTLEIAGVNTFVVDLTKPFLFHKYDWALSLEVGEHIPQEFEDVFLANLDRANKHGIILSWAKRGQGGDGHVNCKNNNEVIEKVCNMGYTFDNQATETLRNSAATYPTPCYWFRDTLMVFRKGKEHCQFGYVYSEG